MEWLIDWLIGFFNIVRDGEIILPLPAAGETSVMTKAKSGFI